MPNYRSLFEISSWRFEAVSVTAFSEGVEQLGTLSIHPSSGGSDVIKKMLLDIQDS